MKNTFTTNTIKRIVYLVCFIGLVLGSQNLINFTVAEPSGNNANTMSTIAFNTEWNQIYGGSHIEIAFSMIQTADGGFALAGFTESYDVGQGDFWLVKTDANGQAEWNQTYGGSLREWAFFMTQTTDGGYALVGNTAAGNGDIWLVKTDSMGQHLWNQTFGGADFEEARSIIQTADGGYAITGNTQSYGAGLIDLLLIKTDVNGSIEWNQTYGGALDEGFSSRSVIQTTDAGYLIAGNTESYAEAGEIWLIKTDINGSVEWDRNYVGTQKPTVIQTTDGGYAIGAGGYDSTVQLIKTDTSGQVIWNQTLNGQLQTESPPVVQTADGGYVIGSDEIYLVKTDANGQKEWEKEFGGGNTRSLVQTTDGGYVVAGNNYGINGGDMWLFKFNISEITPTATTTTTSVSKATTTTSESEATTATTAESNPSFGLELLILTLSLVLFITRKRRR